MKIQVTAFTVDRMIVENKNYNVATHWDGSKHIMSPDEWNVHVMKEDVEGLLNNPLVSEVSLRRWPESK